MSIRTRREHERAERERLIVTVAAGAVQGCADLAVELRTARTAAKDP